MIKGESRGREGWAGIEGKETQSSHDTGMETWPIGELRPCASSLIKNYVETSRQGCSAGVRNRLYLAP